MLYENFYIIWFSHAIRLVKSPICIQDIVLHYQINPIDSFDSFSVSDFDRKMIIYMFGAQRRIKNPVKHLKWSFLQI